MHDLIVHPEYARLPVGKCLCLGKNYELHAKEMGGAVPKDPVVFMKPRAAVINSGGVVRIPAISQNLHHELELVAVIGQTIKNVAEEDAMQGVLGYAVGLDMTLRDVQQKAKDTGTPWVVAKGFDTSAPIGAVVAATEVADPHNLAMTLTVNGEVRQQGNTKDMILSIPRIISYLSTIFTLERGDCIFTGTPEGVGQVVPGDTLRAEIEGFPPLEVTIGE